MGYLHSSGQGGTRGFNSLVARSFWRYKVSMSTLSSAKKKMGRPSVDSEAINTRIERDLLVALDTWRCEQPDHPSRPEAIRRLLRAALDQ